MTGARSQNIDHLPGRPSMTGIPQNPPFGRALTFSVDRRVVAIIGGGEELFGQKKNRKKINKTSTPVAANNKFRTERKYRRTLPSGHFSVLSTKSAVSRPKKNHCANYDDLKAKKKIVSQTKTG